MMFSLKNGRREGSERNHSVLTATAKDRFFTAMDLTPPSWYVIEGLSARRVLKRRGHGTTPLRVKDDDIEDVSSEFSNEVLPIDVFLKTAHLLNTNMKILKSKDPRG
ncbi:hypothetical protein TNCV_3454991 [Trichonephila clavipes]|nr:hypothetical protein TNCV_3454991 [Trichonephila clavipes]